MIERLCRKREDFDVSFTRSVVEGIFFRVCRQLCVIQRVRRRSPCYVDVSFVQFDLDEPVDGLLCLVDEGIQGHSQRRKPETVINEIRIILCDLRFVMGDLFVECLAFQFPMGEMQDHRSRRLVDLTGFDSNQPVLNQIDPSNTVLTADFIERVDDFEA